MAKTTDQRKIVRDEIRDDFTIAIQRRDEQPERKQSWWLGCPDRATFRAAAAANFPAMKLSRFGHVSESNYITARSTCAHYVEDVRESD